MQEMEAKTVALAPALSEADARRITDEVKADAQALWQKLLTLYEGNAHGALGYSSWGSYYAEEFGQHPRTGYKLLDAARVAEGLSAPRGTVGERQARELTPLKDDPEKLGEVWDAAVDEHGPSPTAAQIHEVVEEKTTAPGVRKQKQQERVVAGIVEKARLIEELAPLLDFDAVSAPEGVRDEWTQQLRNTRTVLSRLIGAL